MKLPLLKTATFVALANMASAQTIVSAVNVDLTQIGDLGGAVTDLSQDAHEQNSHVAFNEGVTTLGADLVTNTGTILAGTTVASFYIHMDGVGSDSTVVNSVGSIEFSENVLGIVYSNGAGGSLVLLNATDPTLGVPGVTYNQNVFRGTQENGLDISLTAAGKTVTFENGVETQQQESFRVITAVVPEPSSTALFGLAGLALIARRKR